MTWTFIDTFNGTSSFQEEEKILSAGRDTMRLKKM